MIRTDKKRSAAVHSTGWNRFSRMTLGFLGLGRADQTWNLNCWWNQWIPEKWKWNQQLRSCKGPEMTRAPQRVEGFDQPHWPTCCPSNCSASQSFFPAIAPLPRSQSRNRPRCMFPSACREISTPSRAPHRHAPGLKKHWEKNRAAKFIKHRHLWKKNTWKPSTQIVIGRITRWIPVVYWLLAIINSHVIFTVLRLKASGSNSAVTHDLLPLDLPKGMAPGITRRSAIICHLADPLWFACGFTYKGCVKKWHRAQNRLFHHHFHQFSSCSFEVCLFPDTHCCHP